MADTATTLVKLYTNTFIDQSVNEVPYKLLAIGVNRFEALEQVAQDILALNDIDNCTGVNLDNFGVKWLTFRNGLSDADYRTAIKNRMHVYFSGSTIADFWTVLTNFGAPAGSTIEERLPPEDAEVNIFLNGASASVFSTISTLLNTIRAGGVELDIFNVVSTDKLLCEDGFHLTHEDGDNILLDLNPHSGDSFLTETSDHYLTEDGDNFLIE